MLENDSFKAVFENLPVPICSNLRGRDDWPIRMHHLMYLLFKESAFESDVTQSDYWVPKEAVAVNPQELCSQIALRYQPYKHWAGKNQPLPTEVLMNILCRLYLEVGGGFELLPNFSFENEFKTAEVCLNCKRKTCTDTESSLFFELPCKGQNNVR